MTPEDKSIGPDPESKPRVIRSIWPKREIPPLEEIAKENEAVVIILSEPGELYYVEESGYRGLVPSGNVYLEVSSGAVVTKYWEDCERRKNAPPPVNKIPEGLRQKYGNNEIDFKFRP